MATETFIIDVRTTGTKRSAADVKRIGNSASAVRKTLAFLRAALVAVAAVRVFASLTRDLVAFSDQMLVVKAVTAATTDEFVRLREVAKGLGASTRFTAAEAAEGMAFLARAGFDVNEVIGGIPATLDLAAAAQLDLGRAADIASNLMTSFGRTTAELPDIIDTLVFTANNANTNVQQLADGLKLFAPIASQLGLSLKDASSAMAVLGDAGIQASLAGTGVRRVLTDLEAPTGALAKALDFMNIKFEEVRPSAVGFTGALQRLKEANVGASTTSLLFGKRGGFIAAELLRALGPMGDFREELERIEGTAQRAAAEMESGLGGALRLVRSAFQNLIITFADLGAEDFLNEFFRSLAEGLRAIARNADNVVTAFKTLITVLVARKVLLFGKAAILAAIGLGRMGIVAITTAAKMGVASTAAAVLRTALLRIPFIAVLTGIGLLVTGLAAFSNQVTLTEDSATTLNDVLDTTGDLLKDELVAAVNSLGFEFEDFGDLAEALSAKTARAIAGIVAAFFGIVAAVKAIIARVKLLFLEFLLSIDELQGKIASGFNRVLGALGLDDFKIDLRDNTTEAEALKEEIDALTKSIEAGGGVFESFTKAGRGFFAELEKTTAARLVAERDAAIDALEGGRVGPPTVPDKPETNGGRTDIIEALRGGADDAANEVERLTEALRGLEAAHFPLLAVQDAESEALKIITDAREKGIKLRVDENELIKRVTRSQIGANMTIEQAADEQRVLRAALKATIITLEEFEVLSRKASIAFLDTQRDQASGIERALLKIRLEIGDTASQVEDALTNAFNNAEDALVDFFATGEFSAKKFIDQLTRDLIRINIRKVLAPLFDGLGLGGAAKDPGAAVAAGGATAAATIQAAMVTGGAAAAASIGTAMGTAAVTTAAPAIVGSGSTVAGIWDEKLCGTGEKVGDEWGNVFAQGASLFDNVFQQLLSGIGGLFGGGGSGGGFLGSIFGLFGGGGGATGGPQGAELASLSAAFTGFASGGSFTVGAGNTGALGGGIDDRLVAFRARKGEDVTVTPKNQSGQGSPTAGTTNIVFNIQTQDADSFRQARDQIMKDVQVGMVRATRRNG